MLKTQDYLKLSDAAYKTFNSSIKLPKGYYLLDATTNSKSYKGYNGYAIYNKDNNHIIIASSGTSIDKLDTETLDLIHDLKSDANLLNQKLPSQFEVANTFLSNILSEFYFLKGLVHITFTGHSLGAALSELLLAKTIEQGFTANAITFDGPGTLPIIENNWAPHIVARVMQNTEIHLGASNVINKINKQAGKVYQLKYHGKDKWMNICQEKGFKDVKKIVESLFPAISKYNCETFMYPSHKMTTFLNQINQKTGEFFDEKRVINWNEHSVRPEIYNNLQNHEYLGKLFDDEVISMIIKGYEVGELAQDGLNYIFNLFSEPTYQE